MILRRGDRGEWTGSDREWMGAGSWEGLNTNFMHVGTGRRLLARWGLHNSAPLARCGHDIVER
jgi:hypothetical protein